MFKCKFKKIHASSPVKLKEKFLAMFQEIFMMENKFNKNQNLKFLEKNIISSEKKLRNMKLSVKMRWMKRLQCCIIQLRYR